MILTLRVLPRSISPIIDEVTWESRLYLVIDKLAVSHNVETAYFTSRNGVQRFHSDSKSDMFMRECIFFGQVIPSPDHFSDFQPSLRVWAWNKVETIMRIGALH
jgi:hypothetical protein